jgi:hypothetical protein
MTALRCRLPLLNVCLAFSLPGQTITNGMPLIYSGNAYLFTDTYFGNVFVGITLSLFRILSAQAISTRGF